MQGPGSMQGRARVGGDLRGNALKVCGVIGQFEEGHRLRGKITGTMLSKGTGQSTCAFWGFPGPPDCLQLTTRMQAECRQETW